jgi:hypothetical protein
MSRRGGAQAEHPAGRLDLSFASTNVSDRSRTELKTLVDRCTPAD